MSPKSSSFTKKNKSPSRKNTASEARKKSTTYQVFTRSKAVSALKNNTEHTNHSDSNKLEKLIEDFKKTPILSSLEECENTFILKEFLNGAQNLKNNNISKSRETINHLLNAYVDKEFVKLQDLTPIDIDQSPSEEDIEKLQSRYKKTKVTISTNQNFMVGDLTFPYLDDDFVLNKYLINAYYSNYQNAKYILTQLKPKLCQLLKNEIITWIKSYRPLDPDETRKKKYTIANESLTIYKKYWIDTKKRLLKSIMSMYSFIYTICVYHSQDDENYRMRLNNKMTELNVILNTLLNRKTHLSKEKKCINNYIKYFKEDKKEEASKFVDVYFITENLHYYHTLRAEKGLNFIMRISTAALDKITLHTPTTLCTNDSINIKEEDPLPTDIFKGDKENREDQGGKEHPGDKENREDQGGKEHPGDEAKKADHQNNNKQKDDGQKINKNAEEKKEQEEETVPKALTKSDDQTNNRQKDEGQKINKNAEEKEEQVEAVDKSLKNADAQNVDNEGPQQVPKKKPLSSKSLRNYSFHLNKRNTLENFRKSFFPQVETPTSFGNYFEAISAYNENSNSLGSITKEFVSLYNEDLIFIKNEFEDERNLLSEYLSKLKENSDDTCQTTALNKYYYKYKFGETILLNTSFLFRTLFDRIYLTKFQYDDSYVNGEIHTVFDEVYQNRLLVLECTRINLLNLYIGLYKIQLFHKTSSNDELSKKTNEIIGVLKLLTNNKNNKSDNFEDKIKFQMEITSDVVNIYHSLIEWKKNNTEKTKMDDDEIKSMITRLYGSINANPSLHLETTSAIIKDVAEYKKSIVEAKDVTDIGLVPNLTNNSIIQKIRIDLNNENFRVKRNISRIKKTLPDCSDFIKFDEDKKTTRSNADQTSNKNVGREASKLLQKTGTGDEKNIVKKISNALEAREKEIEDEKKKSNEEKEQQKKKLYDEETKRFQSQWNLEKYVARNNMLIKDSIKSKKKLILLWNAVQPVFESVADGSSFVAKILIVAYKFILQNGVNIIFLLFVIISFEFLAIGLVQSLSKKSKYTILDALPIVRMYTDIMDVTSDATELQSDNYRIDNKDRRRLLMIITLITATSKRLLCAILQKPVFTTVGIGAVTYFLFSFFEKVVDRHRAMKKVQSAVEQPIMQGMVDENIEKNVTTKEFSLLTAFKNELGAMMQNLDGTTIEIETVKKFVQEFANKATGGDPLLIMDGLKSMAFNSSEMLLSSLSPEAAGLYKFLAPLFKLSNLWKAFGYTKLAVIFYLIFFKEWMLNTTCNNRRIYFDDGNELEVDSYQWENFKHHKKYNVSKNDKKLEEEIYGKFEHLETGEVKLFEGVSMYSPEQKDEHLQYFMNVLIPPKFRPIFMANQNKAFFDKTEFVMQETMKDIYRDAKITMHNLEMLKRETNNYQNELIKDPKFGHRFRTISKNVEKEVGLPTKKLQEKVKQHKKNAQKVFQTRKQSLTPQAWYNKIRSYNVMGSTDTNVQEDGKQMKEEEDALVDYVNAENSIHVKEGDIRYYNRLAKNLRKEELGAIRNIQQSEIAKNREKLRDIQESERTVQLINNDYQRKKKSFLDTIRNSKNQMMNSRKKKKALKGSKYDVEKIWKETNDKVRTSERSMTGKNRRLDQLLNAASVDVERLSDEYRDYNTEVVQATNEIDSLKTRAEMALMEQENEYKRAERVANNANDDIRTIQSSLQSAVDRLLWSTKKNGPMQKANDEVVGKAIKIKNDIQRKIKEIEPRMKLKTILDSPDDVSDQEITINEQIANIRNEANKRLHDEIVDKLDPEERKKTGNLEIGKIISRSWFEFLDPTKYIPDEILLTDEEKETKQKKETKVQKENQPFWWPFFNNTNTNTASNNTNSDPYNLRIL